MSCKDKDSVEAKRQRKNDRVYRLMWVMAVVSAISMIVGLIEQFSSVKG